MTRRRVTRVAVVAVVALAVAEVGTGLLGPYLPEPMLYADEGTAVKATQLEELSGRERCATVVIAGNSMARDDLVPARMAAELPDGVAVYNAALDGASPELLEDWLLSHVLPEADPEAVVIGLSSFDLNDQARISGSALDSHEAAPLTRTDLFGRLQQPLIRGTALFRHRAELRDPATLWSSLGRARDGNRAPRVEATGIPGVLDRDGAGLSRRDLRYTAGPGSDTLARTELLNDFTIGGPQEAALRAVVEELTGRGVEVALVVLPVTEDYITAHPGRAADHDRFLDLVEEVAVDTDVALLDLHDWAEPGEFADTHHLAGSAADRLSAELPTLLADAGVAPTRC